MGSRIDASITSPEYEDNINVTLKRLRRSHLNKVIYPYLNISSIRISLVIQIKQQMEILIFCVEQKRNQMNLFPVINSYISIISPYILNITENKSGLMVFVKSHIPSRRLNGFKIPSNIQIIPFETNLSNDKWLVASIYEGPSIQIFSLIFGKSIRILLYSV